MRTIPLQIIFAVLPSKFEFVMIFLLWNWNWKKKLRKTTKIVKFTEKHERKKVQKLILGQNRDKFLWNFCKEKAEIIEKSFLVSRSKWHTIKLPCFAPLLFKNELFFYIMRLYGNAFRSDFSSDF